MSELQVSMDCQEPQVKLELLESMEKTLFLILSISNYPVLSVQLESLAQEVHKEREAEPESLVREGMEDLQDSLEEMESLVVQGPVENPEFLEFKDPRDFQETQWFLESVLEDPKDLQVLQEVCFTTIKYLEINFKYIIGRGPPGVPGRPSNSPGTSGAQGPIGPPGRFGSVSLEI